MGSNRLTNFDYDLGQNQTDIHQLGVEYTSNLIDNNNGGDEKYDRAIFQSLIMF